MQTIVIALGGSVFLADDATNEFITKLVNVIQHAASNKKLYIVVGGGPPARQYIRTGRKLKLTETHLDTLGIAITRINAQFFATLTLGANIEVPKTTSQAITLKYNPVVMGGTTPGHSTDMVAAELAEKTHADLFIIATNVDGIYDKDPNQFKDAKQLKTVHIDDLIKQYGTAWESAGKNMVVDGPALAIIKQARLKTYVLNGKRVDQLEKALDDKPFIGTKILV